MIEMDVYNCIKQDINSFVRTWTKTGIIVNPQVGGDFFSFQDKIVSKHCMFENEEEFIQKFTETYEAGQYFCALEDGSYFQISYNFERKKKNKKVVKASLSYLPCVVDGVYRNDYVRLDYDASNQSFFHPASHLHVGFRGNIRIATDELLLFSEFFKFIMYLYYPKIYLQLEHKEKVSHSRVEDEGKLTQYMPISKELMKFAYLKTSGIN